ncbi:MAG TPA: HAMP domain-containing sensor histidine kinase [Acetobacteraceae bacterium]|nr:HAMP domain-containing sensor histidine kinase [Acetobacteraceae bacterium]
MRTRLLRTASFRLAALYLLLFTASAAALGGAVFWMTHESLLQQLKSRVHSALDHFAEVDQQGGAAGLVAHVRRYSRGAGALDYLVQSPDGARLAGQLPMVGDRRGWLRLIATDQDGTKPVLAYVKQLPDGVVVAVADDLRRVYRADDAVLRAVAFSIAVTILIGGAGGVWLSRVFLHRVDAMSRTAEAIIDGDLGQRIPLRGSGDDLDRLAETLNRMLDRIEKLLTSVREASNNIAHDLRTPLSRLRQHLEEARGRTGSEADHDHALDRAKTEVDALLGTFAALLRIAEVEAGAQRAAFCRVDLSNVAETVADAFAPSAEDEGRCLTADVAPGVVVHGDKELLTQMLVNLVDNALRHTPCGTEVRLSLLRQGRQAVLAVEDNGAGIPEAERAHVLRRFYRLDHSRTTPGSGLGLSLVAAVAELHGAALRLEDARPGLRVSVALGTMGDVGALGQEPARAAE